MRDELSELIAEYNMLPPGTRVLCAVSGGADSVYLLHRLYHLRCVGGFALAAAHYNHHLRGEESDRDEAFVRDFVSQYCGPERVITPQGEKCLPKVELYVGGGDVAAQAKKQGTGIEETAREMRYAFLWETAQRLGCDVIATAHNANDNAETVLLHLIRGSGLRGLTGIAPVRGKLIRPMLTTTRREIEDYLSLYDLPHVEDSTNSDDTYSRNRVRHQIVPALKEIDPWFIQRMGDTARLLGTDEEYLSRQASELLAELRWEGECLTIPAATLAKAPEALAPRAVRQIIGLLRTGNDNCTAAHLRAVVELCRGEDPSARTDLPGDLSAWREYELLFLGPSRAPEELTGQIALTMPGETWAGAYRLECREAVYRGEKQEKNRFFLSREKCPAVTVRGRRTGDRLCRPGRPDRTVKKIMIDEKIPARYRDSLPVLEVLGRAAAVAELGPDAAFLPQMGETAWQITITPPERPGQQ